MFYAFPGTKLELKNVTVSVEPPAAAKVETKKEAVTKKEIVEVNGAFRVLPGKKLPDQWKELKKKWTRQLFWV